MVDSISGYIKGGRVGYDKPKELEEAKAQVDSRSTGRDDDAPRSQATGDVVELSEPMKAELKRSEFDQEKVERIKNAIAEGNYPIDGKRVAESFAAIEKLI